jgi:hypothetical protein
VKKKKHWYDYLWIWAILYFALGFFNILFAWFGMIDFLLPLGIAIFGGNKFFCNHLCGRGQLFSKLGGDLKCFVPLSNFVSLLYLKKVNPSVILLHKNLP